MARSPLLQLNQISLTFGGDPVFHDLDLVVHSGDRVALVGRNGTGKSTLMKVMAGLVEADRGLRVVPPGSGVGYMEQDPTMEGFATLGDYAASALEPGELYRVERAGEGLKFDPDRAVSTASGGERRRAALAKLMAEAPELMLLDEPTNHLDIQAISWLENELKSTRAAYVLISHDRAFLNALTRATLWIDRGQVRRNEEGFAKFEAWRDKVWDEEDMQRHERASMIKRQGTAAMELAAAPKSGRKMIEATEISKNFGEKIILKPFSIKIQRGDRIAFVGPNGVGKTTVLNMLMGTEAPDTGTVQHGTNLLPALFDQTRAQLDPDMTLWESLAGDPEMRVSGKADQVLVRGQPKHVVGYLKEFLFDEAQARAPIRSLSGGEKARVLLAKIMARESNLLVLDEPTNDLDVETLDLLQELLDDYDGTVILVSHDRDFLDRVATATVAMEGDGRATVYAGGWSDYQSQKPKEDTAKPEGKRAQSGEKSATKPQLKKKEAGLSYTEKHRLEKLPAIIERLEAEITKLEEFMSDPDLFSKEPVKWQKATEALVERQTALAEAEEEWLVLEEKASAE